VQEGWEGAGRAVEEEGVVVTGRVEMAVLREVEAALEVDRRESRAGMKGGGDLAGAAAMASEVVVMEEAGMVMERSAVGEVVVEDEEEKRLDLRRKTCTLGIYPKSTHRSGNTGEKEGAVQRQRECTARDHSHSPAPKTRVKSSGSPSRHAPRLEAAPVRLREYTKLSVSSRPMSRMTKVLGTTVTWPSGTRAAAQMAPYSSAAVSGGRMWKTHTSDVSPTMNASPEGVPAS
jgi:hypothetical protein